MVAEVLWFILQFSLSLSLCLFVCMFVCLWCCEGLDTLGVAVTAQNMIVQWEAATPIRFGRQ